MAATQKPIVVNILGTRIAIDPESWTLVYGVEGRAEIRDDVKAYVVHTIREIFNDNGVLAEED